MSNGTETEAALAVSPGMRLDAAQTAAAELLQQCNLAALDARRAVARLEDDVRTLEEVLPVKRAALARAQKDYDETRALLRENFSLYRDLMGINETERTEVTP